VAGCHPSSEAGLRAGHHTKPRAFWEQLVDPIAQQVAVVFFDEVAEVNADAKINALTGRQPRFTCSSALDGDGAAHGFNDTAEFNQRLLRCV
jgi:hypothetical protein